MIPITANVVKPIVARMDMSMEYLPEINMVCARYGAQGLAKHARYSCAPQGLTV